MRGMRRTRRGFAPDPTKGTFGKVPLEPPKAFGAGDYVAEWWRALIEGYMVTPTFVRVRDRGQPTGLSSPAASPPCF